MKPDLLFFVLPFWSEIIGQNWLLTAREQQIEREAEELQTTYSSGDLRENWEFKILRGYCGDFSSTSPPSLP